MAALANGRDSGLEAGGADVKGPAGGQFQQLDRKLRAAVLVSLCRPGSGNGIDWAVLGGGTMENSQCVVRLNESSTSGEGTTLRVTVVLTLKAGCEGAKGGYFEVEDYGGLRAA